MKRRYVSNRIGFHARNMDEFYRVIGIEGADLVELKPDKFAERDGVFLYHYDGGFKINYSVINEISTQCLKNGVLAQIHIPFEDDYDINTEKGLCQAERAHHDMLLSRYKMFGELHDDYGIGAVLTTHPPAFKVNGKEWSEEEAFMAGIELYQKVDKLIKDNDYGFKLGIENIVLPKDKGTCLIGYKPEHIDRLIGYASEIGITVDAGYRKLNDEMSIAKLMSYADVVNVHFHTNSGKIHKTDFKDDKHMFATRDNLPFFNRYLKAFRRRKMPIVLEINKLDKYTDNELSEYVMNLRREIENPDR